MNLLGSFIAKMRAFTRFLFVVLVAKFEFAGFRKQKIQSLWPFPWKWSVWQNPDQERTNQNVRIYLKTTLPSGAIIGDGDRKRAPFLVLGLAPWYGTIFLFLEQMASSPSTHARTCCEDFCGWRGGEMVSKIPEIFYAFGPQLNAFMSVGILLKYFRRKLLQFWMK